MTQQESLQAKIQSALARMRDRSVRAFRSQFPIMVEVTLKDRSARQFHAVVREWLHENCSGGFVIRLDIEAVGFADEVDAVAFALRFAA